MPNNANLPFPGTQSGAAYVQTGSIPAAAPTKRSWVREPASYARTHRFNAWVGPHAEGVELRSVELVHVESMPRVNDVVVAGTMLVRGHDLLRPMLCEELQDAEWLDVVLWPSTAGMRVDPASGALGPRVPVMGDPDPTTRPVEMPRVLRLWIESMRALPFFLDTSTDQVANDRVLVQGGTQRVHLHGDARAAAEAIARLGDMQAAAEYIVRVGCTCGAHRGL